MNKYIYHGGKSAEEGLATVSVAKTPGTDRYDVQFEFYSISAGMNALEAIVRCYAEYMGVPPCHIASVLGVVTSSVQGTEIRKEIT